MRHIAIALPAILALTACATPRESCIAAANRDGRVVNALIAETRGNIARGFAVAERQEIRVKTTTCEAEGDDGVVLTFECEETDTVTVREPVAIDLNAERAKLASLEERQRQNAINAQAAIQQCIAANPE